MTGRASARASGHDDRQRHHAPLADALLDALDDDATRELALRLRPHLPLDPGRLLDARAAAELLGLHPDTLVRMARGGRIWAQKVGREWRFRADRLEITPLGADAPLTSGSPRARRASEAARASVTAIRGRS